MSGLEARCELRRIGLVKVAHDRLVPVSEAPAALSTCSGRLDPCHLISRQKIRQRFPNGVAWDDVDHVWIRATPDQHVSTKGSGYRRPDVRYTRIIGLQGLIEDERCWIRGCRGHHHHFDTTRKLKIPRSALPDGLWEYAAAFGFTTFVETEYPQLEEVT